MLLKYCHFWATRAPIHSIFATAHPILSCSLVTRKSRKIRHLSPASISFQNDPNQSPIAPNYVEIRKAAKALGNWELLPFHELCNLDPQILRFLQLEVKKDKFNTPDDDFYFPNGDLSAEQPPLILNDHYKKMHALLANQHENYDELRGPFEAYEGKGYLVEMFIMQLQKDKELTQKIGWFIEHISQPTKMERVTEPSFVKYLLALKRQLLMQGVIFEKDEMKKHMKTLQRYQHPEFQYDREDIDILMADGELVGEPVGELVGEPVGEPVEQTENEFQDEDEEKEERERENRRRMHERKKAPNRTHIANFTIKHVPKVKILKALNYEYEFWVDVKTNRNYNIEEGNYIIEEREIPNSNPQSDSRTIQVTYFVHKRRREKYEMHFTIKAEVLVRLENGSVRRVKVEWKGPGKEAMAHASKGVGYHRDYIIIDYEGLMQGNPTIRPLFRF